MDKFHLIQIWFIIFISSKNDANGYARLQSPLYLSVNIKCYYKQHENMVQNGFKNAYVGIICRSSWAPTLNIYIIFKFCVECDSKVFYLYILYIDFAILL